MWRDSYSQRRHSTDCIQVGPFEISTGERVMLRPMPTWDAADAVLAGQTAIVVAIEHDSEGRVYLAVVLEQNPGRPFQQAAQSGHLFYFRPYEVEPACNVDL